MTKDRVRNIVRLQNKIKGHKKNNFLMIETNYKQQKTSHWMCKL